MTSPAATVAPGGEHDSAVGERYPAPSLRPAARPPWLGTTRDALLHGFGGDVGVFSRAQGHDFARLRIGARRAVTLAHPDHVEHVMLKNQPNYRKGFEFDAIRIVFGTNLATDEGESWRRHRKLLTPMFAKRHLTGLVDLMTEPTALMADRVRGAGDHELSINQLMMEATLDIFGRTMFGGPLSGYAEAMEEAEAFFSLQEKVEHALLAVSPPPWAWSAMAKAILSPVPLPPPVGSIRRVRSLMHDTIWEIVNDRQANPTESPELLNRLLDVRYEDGTPLTPKRVEREALVFIGAAHDTTTLGLSWMWWLLASHPDAYDRLLAEVDEVLGGRAPTAEDLPNLPWTQACFEEALRMYGPVWLLPREALDDDVIGTHHVKGGTSVFVLARHLHYDERFWDEPQRFDPSRFLPENADRLVRFAYLPFGAGRRQCIGQTFALMDTIVIIAMLCQRVRFETVPGHTPEPTFSIMLRPRADIRLRVRPREGAHA